MSDVQWHTLTAAQRARMYVRACVHAPTRMYGRARTTARARARRARPCINSRTRTPDTYFSTPQNNQAHTCQTPGRHATGHGYRAIAATMPQTLKPNETTLPNLAKIIKLNNHPNMAQTLDKMSGQPNTKQHTLGDTHRASQAHFHPPHKCCSKCL